MLKWLTVISLILTFFVGVLSALFKTVREPEAPQSDDSLNTVVRIRRKFPALTGWGWALLTSLLTLCILSIGLVLISSYQTVESERKAEVTRQELTNRLSELKSDNELLRKGNDLLQTGNAELRRLADLNLSELVRNQQEANNRHNQSLDRFSALVTRQELIGRNTAALVHRMSFVLELPGDQKATSAFLNRINRPQANGGRRLREELIQGGFPLLLRPETLSFPTQMMKESETSTSILHPSDCR